MDEQSTKHSGFLFNIFVYTVAGVIASMFPVAMRTVLSIFLRTPSLSELKGDASYLFNVIYPVMAFFTTAALMAGAFVCSYFTAKKLAYNLRVGISLRKSKIQMAISAFLVLAINVWYIFPSDYSGLFGCQYWYASATFASLFGVLDKHNALSYMTNSDALSSFIITGATNYILGFILTSFVVMAVGFAFASYYGRKLGCKHGLEKINAFLDELHS